MDTKLFVHRLGARLRPATFPPTPTRRLSSRRALRAQLLLLAFLVACGDAGPPEPGISVRDSAGIRIIETRPPTRISTAGEASAPDPALVLGDRPREAGGELFRVAGAAGLANGTWAVANAGSREIHLYDRNGMHRRTLGGTGEGPGEFTNLGGVAALPGDTLLAWSTFPPRMTVFDAQGELVRTFTLPASDDRTHPTTVTARLASGTFVGSSETSPEPRPGAVHHALRLFSVDDPSDPPRLIAEIPGFRGFRIVLDGVVLTWQTAFTDRGRWTVHRDRLYAGNGERWEVMELDGEGAIRRIFRLALPRRPVTAEDRDRIRDRFVGSAEDPLRTAWDEAQAETGIPDFMPAWDDLHVDPEGRIWLRTYLPPWEEESATIRPWWVLTADGRALGTVGLPARLDPVYGIRQDGVLGRTRDELDVEQVHLYPLPRIPPSED